MTQLIMDGRPIKPVTSIGNPSPELLVGLQWETFEMPDMTIGESHHFRLERVTANGDLVPHEGHLQITRIEILGGGGYRITAGLMPL